MGLCRLNHEPWVWIHKVLFTLLVSVSAATCLLVRGQLIQCCCKSTGSSSCVTLPPPHPPTPNCEFVLQSQHLLVAFISFYLIFFPLHILYVRMAAQSGVQIFLFGCPIVSVHKARDFESVIKSNHFTTVIVIYLLCARICTVENFTAQCNEFF